ncbi:MAG: HNH endonuclease family protein [Aeromicrobium sp.]
MFLVIGAIALGLIVFGYVIPSVTSGDQPASTRASSSPSTDPTKPAPEPGARSAVAALATLTVKGRAPRTGYDRALFGQSWLDVDRNGCDTRNDILRRDLAQYVLKPDSNGCAVLTGLLQDPYTGRNIAFIRGWESSLAVQIDHVVALNDAWQKGAQTWTTEKRERFANDPLELLAVDGPANGSKSDGDAATWLPPNKPYRCEYIARQVAIKVKYGLSVTAAEGAAMARVLERCPDQKLPRPRPIVLG